MLVVVAYDVQTESEGGKRRLRRIARLCQNYGQRVQFSLFECLVDPAQWVDLRKRLIDEMDEEKDSFRFYFLGSNWKRRTEHVGAKEGYDPEGVLIL